MKNSIYTKLLELQKQNISVTKDGNNPHFKSKYATLNEVLDKVKAPLNKLGVVILFQPEELGLKTILYDTESDTQISGFMKYVGCDNAQKLLACNTYFRRGSLVSMLGLEDEDDDGNAASAPVKKAEPTKKEKEVLVKGSERWGKVVNAFLKGITTIEQVKENLKVSPELEAELLSLTKTTNKTA
jgi:hypothetical protein